MESSGELLRKAHRQLMLGSYERYIAEMFRIRQNKNFVFGEHHHRICEALTRVVKGETRKLIINIAPRYGKCVSPDTLVHTEQGLIEARSVKAGTMLYSYLDGKAVLRKCVAVGKARKYTAMIVTERGIVFNCSTDHPVLTNDRGYVEAAKLSAGDGIVALRKDKHNGNVDIIDGGDFYVERVNYVILCGIEDLIDIEVEDTHNFIGNGIVTHNTEVAVKMFISYGFAINPASRFLHLSYSGSLVMDNSMEVKEILKTDYFQTVFDARLSKSMDTRSRWDTVQGGGLYATSTLGQITGFGAGVTDSDDETIDEYTALYNPGKFAGAIIIDDPLKPDEALSDNVREQVNRRFETTIRNRVNSKRTPIVIIMQRLHEHDLCGYLQEVEPGGWEILSLPCIQYDGDGERALWDFKHTLPELKSLREINPWVFETQYMQNPKPLEGYLFPESETKFFTEVPKDPDVVFIQVDPADEGKDCYCSKVFMVKDGYCYNVDTMYTEDRLEITLPRQKEQILKWKPAYVNIESNTAWRLVSKDIKEWAAEAIPDCDIRRFSVHTNKEVRIFNEAPTIRNRFLYLAKDRQNAEYARSMRERHLYLKMGRNQRDDGVDCDASASYWAKRNGLIEMV